MNEDLEDCALRSKARELIRTGKLPNRRPESAWGGPGEGARCTVCGAAVQGDELEFELEFAGAGNSSVLDEYHLHVRCFRAWELELQPPNNEAPKGGTSNGDDTRSANGSAPNGSEQSSSGASVSGPALLPSAIEGGNMAVHERAPTYDRGPRR
jgi:hypothetical protein